MRKNLSKGTLPQWVNVEKKDNRVLFKAWPYRSVLLSAWEFLRRQGVLWVYPGPYGDYVPEGKGVDLSLLPLTYTPSATYNKANFDTSIFGKQDPLSNSYLYWWRNGYNDSWSGAFNKIFGSQELPEDPLAPLGAEKRKELYREGFDGYPHNMNSVIPDRLLKQHRDWCGMYKYSTSISSQEKSKHEDIPIGKRLPPSEGGPAICLSSSGAMSFVEEKAVHIAGSPKSETTFWVLPMDASRFCACDNCLNQYRVLTEPRLEWVALGNTSVSNTYFSFVAEVAQQVGKLCPGVTIASLAYANVNAPPDGIEKMPENVLVEICQYASTNLPMDAPVNAAMKTRMLKWNAKCRNLRRYEYALLNEKSSKNAMMPLPLMGGIIDHAKFMASLNALNGGTQADLESIPYQPWNHYAFPRIAWNVELSKDQIYEEFFQGYFQEAKEAMKAFYRTLEDYHLANEINLHGTNNYRSDLVPGAFP
ncbi:MAG: DUF4838 domain-containing protein, partial [Planctomycetes bacterium]|nr:DUF4838 domain-containing protein [Planctomycetota bacterium]